MIGELLCVGQFLFGLGFHPVAHAHQPEVVEDVGELEVDQGGFKFCGYLLVERFCECVTEFHSHESTMPSIDLCLPNSLVGAILVVFFGMVWLALLDKMNVAHPQKAPLCD